ncbi:leucyl/phenylalanyl-tRNA--protein transferase [Desulfoferrobacter suflitae]|uniref:leucyl/phenylalanyl-tRNA--protein transferase n=1 Tax=Desulfoferrobacter suflitae TaxID=2865782 RepID=UPI002164E38B|nr:leucyl/phenylalanyl-tRNA--protein transferase [Desulfoferrobacter suflitae]MCK8602832.1 leucyl/phenylalanyl-tRNA--protein transferase [Desulfoferrobacter suflitae]
MPIFRLTKALLFPPCHYAEPDGLLAIGGDLSPERLLLAYRLGIFPWYSEHTPILWWSPDPRLVLFPHELRISKSLQRVIKKNLFTVTVDRSFGQVIQRCAEIRRTQGEGTWILPDMIDAYCRLHRLGFAHSIESWMEGELVGGLYGVAIGRVFFGESMFTQRTDASKVAFVHLVRMLQRSEYQLIDCQISTHHLKNFGAREIPRTEFLNRLAAAIKNPVSPDIWAVKHISGDF